MDQVSFEFLGTCAADFSPQLQDEYKNKFDKDVRRASCAIIDGKYLLDCGPHCPGALQIAGTDEKSINCIFITHTHPDHFCPDSIKELAAKRGSPLKLYIREDAVIPEFDNVEVIRMKMLQTYEVNGEFQIIGLPANHSELAYPRHFYIEYKGKKIFYGMDGGWLTNDEYGYIMNRHLDLCVLDCTVGDYNGDYRIGEHNSIPMIRLIVPSLFTVGAVDEHTVICVSHLARTLHKSHEETADILKEIGVNTAYDGLTVTI